ncbi:cobalt-precorrin 5A acetaldehyde-lyase [Acetitomaculum ruminis DSM 5522]|uniref:Cobalt-precorrin 5A acetaldehyde-lyase n=1 Tax=Acetitomaculum ruminis DSM 5522 TaxID=1120918 RepID=A0A1I0WV72_9FIRM|nr:cobalamin biosynthesis protein [Acetitomaculum ruminis]SFA92551.1 cobalt-precorrin 5A acetaldehyde-lyase [Acetitomaculum ruminis DSM 5522]
MNISIVSFTDNGSKVNANILEKLKKDNDVKAYAISKYASKYGLLETGKPLKEWTKEHFKDDAIIFISATGIAVRSIAPFIEKKTTDPAVIVMDERANFVISLLSGHIGGANELTLKLSKITGALPVITTATDVNNTFAVDVFAVKNNMYIKEMKLAKEVAASVLEHKYVGFVSDFPIEGNIDKALTYEKDSKKPELLEKEIGIHVTLDENSKVFKNTLHLIPKIASLGVGCRKNKDFESVKKHILDTLKKNNISIHSIKDVSSVDLKKDEQGIIKFAQEVEIPFIVYTSKELLQVKGDFSASAFVKNIAGVDNVCERSAKKSASKNDDEEINIIVRKTANDGVTAALALSDWSVKFE